LEYQQNHKYFAQVAGSLEKHAALELTELGAEVIQEVPRGLRFSCDKKTLYSVVYTSRLIQRVLAPLISFQCHSEKYLYNQAFANLDWTSLFKVTDTFAILTNVSNSHISNSLYAGQILKDAICDQFRDKFQARPDFSSKEADIVFSLYINDNWATISLDVAGHSLHKRGYRKGMSLAPLQETLAAAVVKLSGWDGSNTFYDPMCGSGTLLAEALMAYCHIPAGYLRKDNAITFMPDFDAKLWDKVRKEADAQMCPLPDGLIKGSDISAGTVANARTNLQSLPYGDKIELSVSPFQSLPKVPDRTVVTNPPYGVRLGDSGSTQKLYNDLGDFLKQKCPASVAYILCGSAELVPELRLRASWKKTLKNGDLETKLAKIVLR
jgi:putative N6-adenine-specific DNA methylase